MNSIYYGGKKVHFHKAEKIVDKTTSYYEIFLSQSFTNGIFIPDIDITEEIENLVTDKPLKNKINIFDIVDLFCYGNITELTHDIDITESTLVCGNITGLTLMCSNSKNGRYFISDWTNIGHLTATARIQLHKDCIEKFGRYYRHNANIALLPSVRLIEPDLLLFGLYSPDNNKAVIEAFIWDISNNGITDKEEYYNNIILNKLEQLIK